MAKAAKDILDQYGNELIDETPTGETEGPLINNPIGINPGESVSRLSKTEAGAIIVICITLIMAGLGWFVNEYTNKNNEIKNKDLRIDSLTKVIIVMATSKGDQNNFLPPSQQLQKVQDSLEYYKQYIDSVKAETRPLIERNINTNQ